MEIAIKFNKKIYPLEAIEFAIKSFKPLAKFQIKDTKDYVVIVLSPIRADTKETIKDEFSNYVLAYINNNR